MKKEPKLRRSVVMVGGYHWGAPIQVGDQHLARCFLQADWNVAYLSPPLSPFHVLKLRAPEIRERFRVWRSGGVREGRLWHYVPLTLVAPKDHFFLRSSWVLKKWETFTVPRLISCLKDLEFGSVDLIYLRDVRFSCLLDRVTHSKSLFRLADNDAGFREQSRAAHREAESRLLRRVSHVVYTATHLRDCVERVGVRRSTLLPNGVDLKKFGTIKAAPREYGQISGPIAVYVGSIDFWFDFDVLEYLARNLPRVTFVVIGPKSSMTSRMTHLENVRVLGARPHSEIAGYLQHAHVGLIPFNAKEHGQLVNAVNPIKLYEYLACGLPTVATGWEELRTLAPPIELCDTKEEFLVSVKRCLETPPDKATLMEYAKGFAWDKVFNKLMAFLEE